MALFAKRHFFWNEPLFFVHSIRTGAQWATLAATFGVIGLIVSGILIAAKALVLWQCFAFGLGLAALIWFAFEFGSFQRQAELDDDSILVTASGGKFTLRWNYPLREIKNAVIRRDSEIGRKHHRLEFDAGDVRAAIGVSTDVRIERLALALHRAGVAIQLSGWTPPLAKGDAENDYVFEQADHNPTLLAATSAPGEHERLDPGPGEVVTALLIMFWPALIFFAALIGGGVYAWLNWKDMNSVHLVAAIAVTIALMWLAGHYMTTAGEYWGISYLIDIGKTKLRRRNSAIVNADDPQAWAIEYYPPDKLGDLNPQKIDFGFLVADRERRELRYEGNKVRWTLPRQAVRSFRVHEHQFGQAGDASIGQLRCFVMLQANLPDTPPEIALYVASKEPGADNDARRFRVASDLFEAIFLAVR